MVKLVVQPRVEAAWRSLDGMMRRSKWQSRRRIWERSNSERRGKREARREQRDGAVPEGRDGREKGRALGETKEELNSHSWASATGHLVQARAR